MIDGRRWTRKTTHSVAEELRRAGIEISAKAVARQLLNYQRSTTATAMKRGD